MSPSRSSTLALPLVTLWRLRTRTQRRDEWLGANAQPVITAVAYGLAGLTSAGAVLACTLGAVTGHPFLWAPAALATSVLVTTIISMIAAFRVPPDIEGPSS